MREHYRAHRQFRGERLGVEVAREVELLSVVNGFLDSVFLRRVGALVISAMLARKSGQRSAGLDGIAEQIASGEIEDRILSGLRIDINNRECLHSDQARLPFGSLLDECAGQVGTENSSSI